MSFLRGNRLVHGRIERRKSGGDAPVFEVDIAPDECHVGRERFQHAACLHQMAQAFEIGRDSIARQA